MIVILDWLFCRERPCSGVRIGRASTGDRREPALLSASLIGSADSTGVLHTIRKVCGEIVGLRQARGDRPGKRAE
jgi:hypothetical protein